jgi:hypothetical protein
VTLSVEQLQQDKLMGEWYRMQKEHKQGAFATLAGLGVHHSDSIGSLRIGTLLEERVILPICSYKPLIDVSSCNNGGCVSVCCFHQIHVLYTSCWPTSTIILLSILLEKPQTWNLLFPMLSTSMKP